MEEDLVHPADQAAAVADHAHGVADRQAAHVVHVASHVADEASHARNQQRVAAVPNPSEYSIVFRFSISPARLLRIRTIFVLDLNNFCFCFTAIATYPNRNQRAAAAAIHGTHVPDHAANHTPTSAVTHATHATDHCRKDQRIATIQDPAHQKIMAAPVVRQTETKVWMIRKHADTYNIVILTINFDGEHNNNKLQQQQQQ